MFRSLLCLCAAVGMLGATAGQSLAEQITVFAAASMKTALEIIASQFETDTGTTVVLSFAGSSVLARQIEYGAPADLFISANPDWMDHLQRAGRIEGTSRVDLVGNALVLIGGKNHPVKVTADLDLPQLVGQGRLAMALVAAVPAGIYGKAALTSLGLWDGVQNKVAQVDNVRAALALVSQGVAPVGIVYASDARADPSVFVWGQFPAQSHPPIRYPAALVTPASKPGAHRFLAYLQTQPARDVFRAQGFQVLGE